MCGLVGILGCKGPDEERRELIHMMAATMTHRGHDGEGYFPARTVIPAPLLTMHAVEDPVIDTPGHLPVFFGGDFDDRSRPSPL